MPEDLIQFSKTFLVALLGGLAAASIGLPLPWLMGALLSVIAVRCSISLLPDIPYSKNVAQLFLSVAVGLRFTTEILSYVFNNIVLICLAAVITLGINLLAILVFRLYGSDLATAYFSALPGGAAEMSNFAQRNGANIASVVAVHSVRLLLIVVIVPSIFSFYLPRADLTVNVTVSYYWCAGLVILGLILALAWQKIKIPNAFFFAPLLVSAVITIYFDLHLRIPVSISALAQILLGISLATHFDKDFFRKAPGFLILAALITVVNLVVIGFIAYGLAKIMHYADFYSLVLGMTPGGVAEITLTAATLNLSVELVTAVHLARLVLIMVLAEIIFKVWVKLALKK